MQMRLRQKLWLACCKEQEPKQRMQLVRLLTAYCKKLVLGQRTRRQLELLMICCKELGPGQTMRSLLLPTLW